MGFTNLTKSLSVFMGASIFAITTHAASSHLAVAKGTRGSSMMSHSTMMLPGFYSNEFANIVTIGTKSMNRGYGMTLGYERTMTAEISLGAKIWFGSATGDRGLLTLSSEVEKDGQDFSVQRQLTTGLALTSKYFLTKSVSQDGLFVGVNYVASTVQSTAESAGREFDSATSNSGAQALAGYRLRVGNVETNKLIVDLAGGYGQAGKLKQSLKNDSQGVLGFNSELQPGFVWTADLGMMF